MSITPGKCNKVM